MITITENHDVDWSFRDGVAQFVVYPDSNINNHKQVTEIAAPIKTSATNSHGQTQKLLLQDYLVGVIVLALVGLLFWSNLKSGKL